MTVKKSQGRGKAEIGAGQLAFIAALPDTLIYPFRGIGWAAILAGAVFFFLMGVVASSPFLGWVVGIIAGGYLAAYMIKILGASAAGDDRLPDWPEVTDWWQDLVCPLGLLVATVAASFLPLILYYVGHARARNWDPAVMQGLIALGALYLPMALVSVALSQTVEALNPVRVVVGIVKTMPAYLLATAVLAGTYLFSGRIQTHLAGSVPVLGSLAAGAVSLYATMVEMRILGLLYYTHRKRLGWFE